VYQHYIATVSASNSSSPGVARHERLDIRLDRPGHGVAWVQIAFDMCMFSSDGRLTTINRRFAEIFKVPAEAIASGMTVSQIMETVHKLTDITEDNPDLVLSKLNLLVSQHERGTITFNRTDGCVISASHQPMANGGWVETFEDITDQRQAEAKLSYMAHHDMLTDLPNRLSFYEQLEERLT
jgi:PAS domain-containing protein